MDLLDTLQTAGQAANFKETSNFYYEDHICEKSGDNIRIRLDNTLANDVTDSILRFGLCEDCGICFYHKDFQSKGL